jgi:hypothetical protein
MKTYTFRAGWFAWACGAFVQPVTWKEGDAEIEIHVDPTKDTATSNNYQFIASAILLGKDKERKLLLVPDQGAPVRANVREVIMGDPVSIWVQPFPDA